MVRLAETSSIGVLRASTRLPTCDVRRIVRVGRGCAGNCEEAIEHKYVFQEFVRKVRDRSIRDPTELPVAR